MSEITRHPEVRGLPVVTVLQEVSAALSTVGSAVLVAAPGAGKTTVVPLALAEAAGLVTGRIVILEPRRLAARAAAGRMARLWGEAGPGGRVGYRMRGETRVGGATRIEVVTEGVLTRMLQSDPGLGGVGLLIFDEFHERSVAADLGLAMVLHARSLLRSDLKVLVMSATLDAAPVSSLLGDAPVVVREGRQHPVDTRWRGRPVEGWVEPAVTAAVLRALESDEGDVLAFLPGAAEIRRTERRLREAGVGPRVDVRPLYGHLSDRDQALAIERSLPGRRKVVLATAIAETSLTIEGVRVVVDGGLMRVPRFDPGSGMSRLETVRVTRDAADQRRGRAGRTAPGVCYRLWTRAEDRGLVPERRPEILDADLTPLALELAVWGAAPSELRWLDAPPRAAYAHADRLLRALDAIGDDGAATPHGRRIAALGVHPRLGHMLARAAGWGRGDLACDLAALLGERDVMRSREGTPSADLRIRVEALRSGVGRDGGYRSEGSELVDSRAVRTVAREAARLKRLLASSGIGPDTPQDPADASARFDDVGILAALAYPDRIGQRRPGERGRFLLRGGRGAWLDDDPLLAGAEWIVAAELDGRGTEAKVFRAAALTLDAIETHFADQIEEVDEVYWDPEGERVVRRRRRALGALTLAVAPLPAADPLLVTGALLAGIRERWPGALPWTKDTEQLRERLEFLHRLEPDAWPDASREALLAELDHWLGPFLAGLTRLADLRQVDLAAALRSRVSPDRVGRIDLLAPTHVEVPSGSRIRIDYTDPAAPALAVRLQEVFGLMETPTIGGGKVGLVMQLLSPAGRPVQVTRDLASFWRDAYFDVRKDLRGRYPKHHWPADPLAAEPTRGTRRRGGREEQR